MSELICNHRLRVQRNSFVHVKRKVTGNKATIKVLVNQEVAQEEILGEEETPSGFRTIHLSKELNVNPKEALNFLKVTLGQKIFQGELLADKQEMLGMGKRIVVSPGDGILDLYDSSTGVLRIRLLPKKIKVVSGVYGVVDKIDDGIIYIRTMATIIHGVLGSGKERDGILKVIGNAAELVSSKQISGDLKGKIVLCGSIIFFDGLQTCVNLGVSGVIAGGINAMDYRTMSGGRYNITSRKWSDVGVSALFTEGFGAIPIGEDIFSLLSEHRDNFVILDGNKCKLILPSHDPNCIMYIRKVRLPIGNVDKEPEMAVDNLMAGQSVRVISGSSIGAQGTVESIDKAPTMLESGIKTTMVNIKSKVKLRVPYQNIEITS